MLRFGAALLVSAVVTALLLEAGAWGLFRAGVLAFPMPHRGETGFWWHQHPVYGAWHRPNTEGVHEDACYRGRYRINSVGARDVERTREADGRRVVVLGDSYVEGYGVPEESRFSNVLERRTGVPHLNFGMASFGPYQALLVYDDLASEFEHDAVILGVFPGNDFADLHLETCEDFPITEYCYRPYLVDEGEGWRRRDHTEPGWRRLLRTHSYAFNAVASGWKAWRRRDRVGFGSFFYEFDDRQLALLVESVKRLAAAAAPRPLVVVLIAGPEDLKARAERGPDPLSARLVSAWAPAGIRVVNLLPALAARDRAWESYFLTCDHHWSHYGNRVAADVVYEALATDLYPGVEGSP